MSIRDKGFSLIETMVALAILGTVSLTMISMMDNQMKAVTFLEDKLSFVNLKSEISQQLKVNKACDHTFVGKEIKKEFQPFELKNIDDSVYLTSNSNKKNTYDRLTIQALKFRNIDVPDHAGSGWIEVSVVVQRQRKGGGPETLAPGTLRTRVVTTTDNRIASCDTGQITALDCGSHPNGHVKSMTEGTCPDRIVRRDICIAGIWLLYEKKKDPTCL